MITLTGEYALRAMAYLAQLAPGEYALVRDAGKTLDIPSNYLGKVLLTLAQRGMLESQRGRRGGFRLAKPAKNIRLYEILSAVEPASRYETCILGHKVCSDQTACPIHYAWKEARNEVLDLFKNTPLTRLAEHQRSLKPSDRLKPATQRTQRAKAAL